MNRGTDRPRIHLVSLGSVAQDAMALLSDRGLDGMLDLAQQGAGPRYAVTTNRKLIQARQIDEQGGRFDDRARAREVETILADDRVAALVTLRGGGWFTRILDRINFDVLRQRRKPIHIFGFSEMTSLVNIAGQYPKAVGLYDLGPAFLIDHLAHQTSGKTRSSAKREKQAGSRVGQSKPRAGRLIRTRMAEVSVYRHPTSAKSYAFSDPAKPAPVPHRNPKRQRGAEGGQFSGTRCDIRHRPVASAPGSDSMSPNTCAKSDGKQLLTDAFCGFFRDVADILDGRGSQRFLNGRLLCGRLPNTRRITVVGGNLSVLMPLLASPFAKAVDTRNRWLALEDVNESPSSIDRMLAGLLLRIESARVRRSARCDHTQGDNANNDSQTLHSRSFLRSNDNRCVSIRNDRPI